MLISYIFTPHITTVSASHITLGHAWLLRCSAVAQLRQCTGARGESARYCYEAITFRRLPPDSHLPSFQQCCVLSDRRADSVARCSRAPCRDFRALVRRAFGPMAALDPKYEFVFAAGAPTVGNLNAAAGAPMLTVAAVHYLHVVSGGTLPPAPQPRLQPLFCPRLREVCSEC